ncbi:MAG: DNA-processing protein DprA [Acidimicrobiales bacterium]|jgi:DNA processing protein|nr:DNA-processing protein DprA [Acidimicrobiales bacterium]
MASTDGVVASMSELPDAAWLTSLLGLPAMGPRRLGALLDGRSPSEAWTAVRSGRPLPEVADVVGGRVGALFAEWAKAAGDIDPAVVWAATRAAGVEVVTLGDAAYPRCLLADPEPAPVLFALGRLDAVAVPSRVAIVGTRRCTRYGRDVATELGGALAEAGVAVVSGLALGIDGAAHTGALAAGGAPPIGVVATGLDIVYPAANRRLWNRVAEAGVLFTEAPLGTGPRGWRFPSRNRIIAGFADVVVVVESHASGGSLYTVEAALDRNRPVLAVPGPIHSPASRGTNHLLAEGCVPLCGIDDVLTALGLVGSAPLQDDRRTTPDGSDLGVLDAAGWSPTTLDALARRVDLAPVDLASSVARLVRTGWFDEERGFYQRVR